MLPRSCLRLADSKSNSSTRLPRRTTTRVSSGWVASISILLGIDQSLDGLAAHRCLPAPRGRGRTVRGRGSLIRVERMGLERGRAERIARNGVARRRDGGATAFGLALGLALDARSLHDLGP